MTADLSTVAFLATGWRLHFSPFSAFLQTRRFLNFGRVSTDSPFSPFSRVSTNSPFSPFSRFSTNRPFS